MALDVEGVVGGCMKGEESLGLTLTFEPLRFLPSRRSGDQQTDPEDILGVCQPRFGQGGDIGAIA